MESTARDTGRLPLGTGATGPAVDGVDPAARRFVYVEDGQVYPMTLDGVATEIEHGGHGFDEPLRNQLYAVAGSTLAPVELKPLHRPYVDAADYIHAAYAVVAVSAANVEDSDDRRYFGTVYTTIDGRI
jgi:hypothetical protein